jgi:hypothetical protein
VPAVVPDQPIPWEERPVSGHDAVGEPVVLAAGRAPEGARYEWYVERLGNEDGEVTGICQMLWWPRFAQAGAGGACGTGIPPEAAFKQRRNPSGPVLARPYGFLDAAEPATEHFMLSGFARQQVDRVRLTWDDARDEAPVELFPVTPEKAERMGASGPFGYWVSFVPRSARHAEFEVVSYGEDGDEIGRYEYRSDVTN